MQWWHASRFLWPNFIPSRYVCETNELIYSDWIPISRAIQMKSYNKTRSSALNYLWYCIIFTGVCLSTGRGVSDVTSCLAVWSHVPSSGGLCPWSPVPSGGLCPGVSLGRPTPTPQNQKSGQCQGITFDMLNLAKASKAIPKVKAI